MADLQETSISPSRIVVEVTEAVLIQDDVNTFAALKELSAQGMRVALDDFGHRLFISELSAPVPG